MRTRERSCEIRYCIEYLEVDEGTDEAGRRPEAYGKDPLGKRRLIHRNCEDGRCTRREDSVIILFRAGRPTRSFRIDLPRAWRLHFLQPPFMSFARVRSTMAACKHLRPRRFAPLDPARSSNAPPLKGIVFDVDGTLW